MSGSRVRKSKSAETSRMYWEQPPPPQVENVKGLRSADSLVRKPSPYTLRSCLEPPKYVDATKRLPSLLKRVRNMSPLYSPPCPVPAGSPQYFGCTTPSVTGKSSEEVWPPTRMLLSASTMTSRASSHSDPPKKIANSIRYPYTFRCSLAPRTSLDGTASSHPTLTTNKKRIQGGNVPC